MGIAYLILLAIVLLWLFGAAGLVYMIRHPKRKTYAVALAKGDPTDPADLGLEAQAVTFTLSDKSRTPGWVIEGRARVGEVADPRQLRSRRHGDETDSGGGGPTVVIVHGFADSRYGALKRVPMLLPYARRIVVFDLPGQGDAEAKHGYGGLGEPNDVLAVLGQLEPDDAKQVVLLGASMGAGIAIAAAAKAEGGWRDAILGVIAESPYRHWDEPLHNMFRHRRYPRFPIIPLAGLWLRLTARGFKDFDRAGHAARLACPLLVIHGSEDCLCPIESAHAIADAAPDGRFVQITGGGHNDLPTEHDTAYRDAIDDFFKTLCPPG